MNTFICCLGFKSFVSCPPSAFFERNWMANGTKISTLLKAIMILLARAILPVKQSKIVTRIGELGATVNTYLCTKGRACFPSHQRIEIFYDSGVWHNCVSSIIKRTSHTPRAIIFHKLNYRRTKQWLTKKSCPNLDQWTFLPSLPVSRRGISLYEKSKETECTSTFLKK